MKKVLYSSLFLSTMLFSTNLNIHMNGVLDDDIFIYQIPANSLNVTKLYAAQMHNPYSETQIDGSEVKTQTLGFDGKIKINLKADTENGLIVISTANEREEIHPGRRIKTRTHYKNSPIYVNNVEIIKGILPENDSLPSYPTLFQGKEKACMNDSGDSEVGNYYKFWENATIANAIILPKAGRYKVSYFSEDGNVQGRLSFILKEGEKFDGWKMGSGPMEEIYGDFYTSDQPENYNQYLVEQGSINTIVIWNEDTGENYKIPFVYKWVYKNLIQFYVPKNKG